MTPAAAPPAVVCEGLVQIYRAGQTEVVALRGVDLLVQPGETVTLLGPSGAGKSTLLWLFAGLLQPSAGSLSIFGQHLRALTARQLAGLRTDEVGVVLQNPGRNLLPYATAFDNMAFAQRAGRATRTAKRHRAAALLDEVGIAHLALRRAGALAGGEQQRLAVAMALANEPRLLLADEPTSQLDHESAAAVLGLLRTANADAGTTVVTVSHDPAVAKALGRTVTIRDGRVGAEGRAGEQYVVVGPDGSLQLPPEALGLPPGSLARVVPHEQGIDLQRLDTEEEP